MWYLPLKVLLILSNFDLRNPIGADGAAGLSFS